MASVSSVPRHPRLGEVFLSSKPNEQSERPSVKSVPWCRAATSTPAQV